MNISLTKKQAGVLQASLSNYMASLMADIVVAKRYPSIVANFERQIKELEPILVIIQEELEKH